MGTSTYKEVRADSWLDQMHEAILGFDADTVKSLAFLAGLVLAEHSDSCLVVNCNCFKWRDKATLLLFQVFSRSSHKNLSPEEWQELFLKYQLTLSAIDSAPAVGGKKVGA